MLWSKKIIAALVVVSIAGCGGGGQKAEKEERAVGRVEEVIPPHELAERLAAVQPEWPTAFGAFRPRALDCAALKCVALTFDDGPYRYTAKLLDMLAEHQAKATFFVVGRMVAASGAAGLRRMVAEGHEVGNHTWDHAMLTDLRRPLIEAELRRTQQIVRSATGTRMRIMRPPYGATNRLVARVAEGHGLAQILWDVDTVDWRDRRPALITRRAVAAPPGTIVLLHDIHRTTVEAAPRILSELARAGYTFVTVSELLGDHMPGPGRLYPDRSERELRNAADRPAAGRP
ncbi:polysaccharide deacetylase family protein [Spongiactinospora rosea]|uniref:polysaccharide deacetylase family protein n=1 Tax=Spongiactinospora rosea TaxID=2248750 RepID=UPI001CECA27E|nr:polysaccharide deacetylase family protein [Spongiactinospora rosea]